MNKMEYKKKTEEKKESKQNPIVFRKKELEYNIVCKRHQKPKRVHRFCRYKAEKISEESNFTLFSE